MDTTTALLRIPLLGRPLLNAKVRLYEAAGRCHVPDLAQFKHLPVELHATVRRLSTLLLGHRILSPMQMHGMMHFAERIALTEQAARVPWGRAVVELGSFTGEGTCFLAAGAVHARAAGVWAVDTFEGTTTLDEEKPSYDRSMAQLGGSTLPKFQRHVAMCGLQHYIQPMPGMTTEVARRWTGPQVGLLLVDADHAYESCRDDYLAWKPHLADDAVVMFHDYTPAFPGVIRAVDELAEAESLEPVGTICALKIFRRAA